MLVRKIDIWPPKEAEARDLSHESAHLYINGSKVQSTTIDFCSLVRYGSTYEIKNVKPVTGYKYLGVYSKDIPTYSLYAPNLKSAVGTVDFSMIDKSIAIDNNFEKFSIELEFE